VSVSLPSRELFVVDVPEPTEFSATFTYNFFVQNEGTSETGGIPEKFLKRATSQLGVDFIDFASTRAPRFNVIRWSVPRIGFRLSPEDEQRATNNASITKPGLIADNLERIVSEDDLSSLDYFAVSLGDPMVGERITSFVSSSALQYVPAGDDVGHMKKADSMAMVLPKHISRGFLRTALGRTGTATGVVFTDTDGRNTNSDRFEELGKFEATVQLSGRMAKSILSRAVVDPFCPYASEFSSVLETASRLSSFLRQKAITGLSDDDFKVMIPHVDVIAGAPASYQAILVGFIIDKTEHLPDGSLRTHTPVVIEDTSVGTWTDLRIKYGSTYSYVVRSVALFTTTAIDDETGEVATIRFLVSSRPTPRIVVPCIDEMAPPPPSDLGFIWNREDDKLVIHWAFPPNSQRDIKGFQVMRRSSVDEPFQLIKAYDFNDADLQNAFTIHRSESNIDQSLVELLSSPRLDYVDDDFYRNSKYTYAVCSIDAHGLTSNYSAQFEVSFDSFKNSLIKTLVSHSGAPKPYPNLYLEADLFQDTIRVSGPHSKRLKVYLNPEFYTVVDDNGRRNDVLTTSQKGGSYAFQFINTDRQKMASIKIELDDRRSNKSLGRDKELLGDK
jgi:hypothetical protein